MSAPQFTPPSTNPADLNTLVGLMQMAFRKQMELTDCMLPVEVVNTTTDRKYAQVQPQVQILDSSGSTTNRAQIAQVPVLQLGAGNFVLSFKINPGDKGYIFAADRDISLYLQSGSMSRPNTARIKSFSDAIFIPAILTGAMIDSDDADNAVLQSLDGTIKISLGTAAITIDHPTGVVINCPLTVNGLTTITDDLTVDGLMTGTGGLTVSGLASGTDTVVITGNLYDNGNIAATGTITPLVPPHLLALKRRSPAPYYGHKL